MEKDYFIVVAGGSGSRMKSDVPKQFLELQGLPILMRTINRLHEGRKNAEIILVLPKEHILFWKELCEKFHFELSLTIAEGGRTRFESVKNGLAQIPKGIEGCVGIHDGVRPFVSTQVIDLCFKTAEEMGNAVPAVRPVETVRKDSAGGSVQLNRDELYLIQTPQVFNISQLKEAYNQVFSERFTDDASVVETLGEQIHLVEGNRENIKLTTPYDLKISEVLV